MERPNEKISKFKKNLTIIKNGSKILANVEYLKDGTRIFMDNKEFFIKKEAKLNNQPIDTLSKYYEKIEEVLEGKILACLNCKFFSYGDLIYEFSGGYGGECVFPGNNKDSRVTFDKNEPKEAFIREIEGKEIKVTGILDCCKEFDLGE